MGCASEGLIDSGPRHGWPAAAAVIPISVGPTPAPGPTPVVPPQAVEVGFCVLNPGPQIIDDNGSVNGWVMVTN
jgi:hypothetical protein